MEPKFEYKLRIPAIFKDALAERLAENPRLQKNREKYRYVLHLLARELKEEFKRLSITSGSIDVRTWHARLHSRHLQAILGNDYVKILQDLEYWGFIRRSRHYFTGDSQTPGFSKACWFGPSYAGYWLMYCRSRDRRVAGEKGRMHKKGRVWTCKVESRGMLRKLKAAAEEVKSRCLLDGRVMDCHENLSHFRIDRRAAERALETAVSSDTGKPLSERQKAKELLKVDRFNSAYRSSTAMYVKRDDYGRIHTNVTQMKKEVRKCMRCDGEPVADIDIKSSQAAFIGKILADAVDTRIALDSNASTALGVLRRTVSGLDRGRYLAECGKYKSLLAKGEFYEFLMTELNGDCDLDMEFDRAGAKELFFKFMFGKVEVQEDDIEKAAMRRIWEEHFPTLTMAIDGIKAYTYTAMAHELQRAESHFVFDCVIPRIEKELGCPFCTVHDSVIVPERFAGEAKRIMDEELSVFEIPTMTVAERARVMAGDDEREYERNVVDEMVCSFPGDTADSYLETMSEMA